MGGVQINKRRRAGGGVQISIRRAGKNSKINKAVGTLTLHVRILKNELGRRCFFQNFAYF